MQHTLAGPAGQAPARSARSSWWGDRGVKVKILAGVAVAAVAAGTVGVLGLTALDAAAARTQDLYQSNVRSIVEAANMRGALKDTRVATRDAILSPSGALTQKALDKIATLQTAFHAAADGYAAVPGASAADIADVKKVTAEYDTYVEASETKLKPLALANDYAGWYRVNSEQVAPLATQAESDAAALMVNVTKQAAATAQAASDAATKQRFVQIGVLVGGLVLALLIGYLVARTLARGVARVQKVAEALSNGDLTVSAGLSTRDEIGRMGAALDSAVGELRGVLTTVVSSADAVAASSEELSASSAQISASAEETSAQSGVVAGAAEEVSRNVQTVAAGAEEMGASIREIASNAAAASDVAAKAVTAVETTTATVSKLGDSSAEIGNVVKVITSIAEQTNLLALNATMSRTFAAGVRQPGRSRAHPAPARR